MLELFYKVWLSAPFFFFKKKICLLCLRYSRLLSGRAFFSGSVGFKVRWRLKHWPQEAGGPQRHQLILERTMTSEGRLSRKHLPLSDRNGYLHGGEPQQAGTAILSHWFGSAKYGRGQNSWVLKTGSGKKMSNLLFPFWEQLILMVVRSSGAAL